MSMTATKGIVTVPVTKATSFTTVRGIITKPTAKSTDQDVADKYGIVSERDDS